MVKVGNSRVNGKIGALLRNSSTILPKSTPTPLQKHIFSFGMAPRATLDGRRLIAGAIANRAAASGGQSAAASRDDRAVLRLELPDLLAGAVDLGHHPAIA